MCQRSFVLLSFTRFQPYSYFDFPNAQAEEPAWAGDIGQWIAISVSSGMHAGVDGCHLKPKNAGALW